tara:strand:+ start:1775 stop:2104 length:330 start_codon:yes stop_codon:yes gene_type:complete
MILIFTLVFLILLIIFIGYKLYQFSILILETEEAIEDSLDILNERYISINKILQKEIFFDSVEVRQVLADIKASQEAIVVVANKLTKNVKMEPVNEIKKEDKKIKDNQN